MMGMMGSSMAGSMAGSVIGHGISNAMFGGGSAPAPAAVEGGVPPAGGIPAAPACQFETSQFLQCMSQTADNMDYCRSGARARIHVNPICPRPRALAIYVPRHCEPSG